MLESFTQEDINKITDFLNFVAKKAKFNDISLEDNIKLFKMLNFLQVELLPKMDKLIVDDVKVTSAKEPTPKSKK